MHASNKTSEIDMKVKLSTLWIFATLGSGLNLKEFEMRMIFNNIMASAMLCFMFVSLLLGCSGVPLKPEKTASGDYEYTRQYMTWFIKKEMKSRNITGLSIALVDDQRIVWAQGFGYADESREIPAAPDTIYKIGSITKLFTAAAVMQLAEQGRLDIDRPLQAYVPDFSMRSRFPDGKPITLRDLMTHHSGLPANFLKGMWSRKPGPYTDVVNLIKNEYVAFPPGLVYSYSNLGYTLLGHAVRNVSGSDYASFVEGSLLHPLYMTHSGFSPAPDWKNSISKAYYKEKEFDEPPLRDIPAGGLYSTVLDLSRFLQMIFAGGEAQGRRILKPETLSEMLRPQNASVPLDLGFRIGLGWMLSGLGDIDIQNAGPVAYQPGTTLAFHSQLIILPRHKLGVVVLSNSSTSARVVGKAAAHALTLALEAKTGIKQPEREKPAEGGSPSPESALRAYEGRYATIIGVVDIRRKSDYLVAEAMNRTFRLVPLVDGTLGLKYKFLGLFPVSLGQLDYLGLSRDTVAGRELLVARARNGEFLIGEKIRPVPVPATWRKRVGEYGIGNLGDDFPLLENVDIRLDNGLLIAEYSMPLLFKGTPGSGLEPASDSEAVIYGLGSGKGETVRSVTVNGGEELSYSGYLLRKRE